MANVNDNKYDLSLSRAIYIYFFLTSLNASIKVMFPLSDVLWSVCSLLTGGITLLFIIGNLKILFRRCGKLVINTFVIFIILFAVSCLQNQAEMSVLFEKTGKWTFLFCLPLACTAYAIKNKRLLYDYFLKNSIYISIILSLSCFFQYYDDEHGTYNMFFSNALILMILFHLNEFFRIKKRKYLYVSIVEIILVVLYGSRMSLLALFAFLCMKLFLERNTKRNKTLWFVILTIISSVFLIFSKQIFSFLYALATNIGVYSRTLTLLIADDISKTSGRDLIWIRAIKLIEEKPFFGYGIGGDIIALIPDSPHNGLLQLMLYFGIVGGLIMGLVLIFSIFKIRKIRNQYLTYLMLIFYSAYVVPTMTVGDGVFIKPGVLIYFFIFLSSYTIKSKKQHNCIL